jgi:corrinoid protein of di/trimethylamine methyltransferase
MTKSELLKTISEAIIMGDSGDAADAVSQAIAAAVEPFEILNDGLMAGATIVGEMFEAGEAFLPELMLAGRAMKAAMVALEPTLKELQAAGGTGPSNQGVIVIATVHSDIHDIGKNIVSNIMTASGFEVHDLGVDVPLKEIISRAREFNADIIACSALLTTSMPFLRDLVDLIDAMGERERFKIIVGGAPVTQEFAQEIGSDGTASNAFDAIPLAQSLVKGKIS